MRLWLLALLPVPSLAARPGEDGTVTTVAAQVGLETQSRHELGAGASLRFAIPVRPDKAIIPDLEIRTSLMHTRLPPKDAEDTIRKLSEGIGNPIPSDSRLDYAHWESRTELLASWGATSRKAGLRARVGGLWTLDGDAGARARLEPHGWMPDYTAATRLGLTGAAGFAVPLGDEIGDPLIDLRVGMSMAAPLSAGGGGLSDSYDREFTLTADGKLYGAPQLLGRESRIWGEATAVFDRLHIGVELGLEHISRGAVAKARAQDPLWNWVDEPEPPSPHATITVGGVF
ncbi:MAG: hypothetical protein AB8H79_02010 [Myxococcota bacterium]